MQTLATFPPNDGGARRWPAWKSELELLKGVIIPGYCIQSVTRDKGKEWNWRAMIHARFYRLLYRKVRKRVPRIVTMALKMG